MKKAFTLIELLIVIAIIAILALIAVPNFLEAQVRAKISRCQADMRTIATAVEAYAVDWGRHPIGFWEGNQSDPDNLGMSVLGLERWIWSTLTTPVGYLGTQLHDVFADKGFKSQGGNDRGYRWSYYKYETSFYKGLGAGGQEPALSFRKAGELGVQWCTYTRGPSRITFSRAQTMAAASGYPVGGHYPNKRYDATNGTMSVGHIFRSNKGGN